MVPKVGQLIDYVAQTQSDSEDQEGTGIAYLDYRQHQDDRGVDGI